MKTLASFLSAWSTETPWALPILFITSIVFVIYGLLVFVSGYMQAEYIRYGMSSIQKNLIGGTQVAGSIALVIGIAFPIVGLLAATGFVIMMSAAVWVRWRLEDSLIDFFPAILLFVTNLILCGSYYYWITK